MSNYSKSTNFATKDNLTPGDPLKIVRGTEIDTEFNNIATAIATKTDNASAAVTGGTINDTTIGATTASTGAFTTLAASGAVTLSGGTANGVAYLNGSKVVTSGSALTFDGSNLGLGVTPSAWTTFKVMQLGNFGAIGGVDSTSMNMFANTFYDGAFKYINTSSASRYRMDDGHSWFTAPSGTAGNAITFTQAMTLDASGNMQIGTTTSAGRLTVSGKIRSLSGDIELDSGQITTNSSSNPLKLGVDGSEKARIDSSGNLLIGDTISPGNSNSVAIRKGSAGELILVANNGGLYQQAVSNYYLVTTAGGSTSDATLKKNVQQLSGALAKVCAIRGVNFEFITEQKSTPDNGVQVGIIAQEVEAQYPEIVVTNEDGIKSVRYEKLVAPLIEAIKEQQAIIESLKARLDAANL